jgi:phosphoglycolate phosphatase
MLFVFDLDGTLVDSRRDLAESVNLLLAACEVAPLDEAAIGRMVGEGAATLVAQAFAAAGTPAPPDALERFLTIYDGRLLEHTRPYAGIPGVLGTLAGRGPLAVLTNKPRQSTLSILSGLDLTRYFDDEAIVGGDGRFARKPDPQGLLHLAARAGVAPAATLLVGDSIVDLRTARHAGAGVCLARYGFGFETVSATDLRAADRVIDVPADLLTL